MFTYAGKVNSPFVKLVYTQTELLSTQPIKVAVPE